MPPYCAPPSFIKIPPYCAPPGYIKISPNCAPPSYIKIPPYCVPPSYNKMLPYCIAVSEAIKAKPKHSYGVTSFFCHVILHFTYHHFLFLRSDALPCSQPTFIRGNLKPVKCFFFPINFFYHYFLLHLLHLSLLLFLLKDLEFGLPSTKSREPYHVNHYRFSTLGAQIGKFDSVLQVLCSTITEMEALNLGTLCTRKHV